MLRLADLQGEGVAFQEVMRELKISEATIRNWIKAGYLRKASGRSVALQDYQAFKREMVGKHKLNKRANKLFAPEGAILGAFILPEYAQLKQMTEDQLEEIAGQYERSLGQAHRNQEGIFYTPVAVVSSMTQELSSLPSDGAFLDPCCGTGNFLLSAVDRGISPENVFGYDTDVQAVRIAKARFYAKTGRENDHIRFANFLDEITAGKIAASFDYIFTNPPWGKKVSSQEKTLYAMTLGFTRGMDTCALFSAGCVEALKEGGTLGLLLPESFFNISAYRPIREMVLRYSLLKIEDHNKPFDGLLTRAQSMILRKVAPSETAPTRCVIGKGTYTREQRGFLRNPGNILNFYTPTEEAATIDHLFSKPHTTLENRAQWALGIVTGNNAAFISKYPKEGFLPVHKGADITRKGIRAASHWITEDFSKFQQVAPLRYYQAREKIVYRFIGSDLCFAHDTQQRYFLNSANMLIPNKEFGISFAELTFLLTSKVMNWLFNRLFKTHKILRSDIEALPVFQEFFSHGGDVTEQALHDFLGIEAVGDGTFRIKK